MKPVKCFAIVCGLFAAWNIAIATEPAKANGAATPAPSAAASVQSNFSAQMLAAARAGDPALVKKAIADLFASHSVISEQDAGQMLDSLLANRELKAFTILLAELRQTNLGKDWQPVDELLAGLVKDRRTDFLDVLLASRLDPGRLKAQEKNADSATRAWIDRRVAETQRQRDDVNRLIAACGKGDAATVRQLLDAGIDVNCRALDEGWTPLTRAAADNRLDVVKLLLARGAQVDSPKYPGWDYTPLCLTSSTDVANALKAAGANIHANLFRRNVSILTYVAMFNGAPMVKWFIDQGLDPKMLGDNKETLLFNAKDAATAELLLKAGVNPNQRDEGGRLPLQEARSAGVVNALIKGGASLTGTTKYPLVSSMVQLSSADAIEAVIKAGAPHTRKILQIALIGAAHMDQDKTAEVLIKYGADPNSPAEWSGPKDTLLPLEVCCIFGCAKTAKVLIAHGADPNGGKEPGRMLKIAINNRYKDVAEILKKAGAKGVSDLAYAIAIGDTNQVTAFLASALAYDDNPEFWSGVLSAAAERGDLPTVKAALAKGVPVIVRKRHDGHILDDAYDSAAFEGQWEVLDYLLHQRKPNANPADLAPALWGAVWNSHPYENQRAAPNFEKCVKLLLTAAAPVAPVPTFAKGTPDYDLVTGAVFTRNPGGNIHVIEMLVAAGANPNPAVGNGKHLLDQIEESCKGGYCSTPDEQIVATIKRLATQTQVAKKE